MLRNKWMLRSLFVAVAGLGIFLLLAVALQVPVVGETIGSPQACGTCHVMGYEVVTLANSSHRDLTCLECHSPTGFVEKPVDEIKASSRHIYYFVTGNTPDVIRPNDEARKIIQGRCEQCHAKVTESTAQVNHKSTGRFCFDCHREVPHGKPLRN